MRAIYDVDPIFDTILDTTVLTQFNKVLMNTVEVYTLIRYAIMINSPRLDAQLSLRFCVKTIVRVMYFM